MSTVAEILHAKGTTVHTVSADAFISEAVRVMNERRIGALVVLEPSRDVSGIITERDMLTRVLGEQRDPRKTRVRDVMTTDLVWCGPATGLDELRTTIRERRIRHIPVRNENGALAGLVSLGDLNAHDHACLCGTVASLEEYIARA